MCFLSIHFNRTNDQASSQDFGQLTAEVAYRCRQNKGNSGVFLWRNTRTNIILTVTYAGGVTGGDGGYEHISSRIFVYFYLAPIKGQFASSMTVRTTLTFKARAGNNKPIKNGGTVRPANQHSSIMWSASDFAVHVHVALWWQRHVTQFSSPMFTSELARSWSTRLVPHVLMCF